jgi:hypothetical protein
MPFPKPLAFSISSGVSSFGEIICSVHLLGAAADKVNVARHVIQSFSVIPAQVKQLALHGIHCIPLFH